MSGLPAHLGSGLLAALVRDRHPAYLLLDDGGRVVEWGGDFRRYGLADPNAGSAAAECIPALQGIVPVKADHAVLSCVQMGDGCVADVFLFPDGAVCAVVVLDATAEAQRRQQVHQLTNERALQRRKGEAVDAVIVVELLAALDVLVIDHREDVAGVIGQVPEWFGRFLPQVSDAARGPAMWERFPFLGNFLIDARMHWTEGTPGAIKSGIWFELDDHGNECALEATALSLGPRHILLVELLSATYQERRRLIQKAREGQLHSDALRKAGARLASQAEELNRSNSELQQFAYAASHDLRAPLRAIHSLTSWLEQDLGEAINDEVREILGLLKDRAKRMDHMINGLLDYARADFSADEPSPVDVAELVRELWFMLAPPAGFALDVPEGAAVVHIARAPLAQVLRNLMGNAIQHHDRSDGRIAVGVVETDGGYEITVADDGPGIDARHHERMFQMFQTLQPQSKATGSGMGLAMVKKIVTQHGGVVQVEPTRERGALFRIIWPRH